MTELNAESNTQIDEGTLIKGLARDASTIARSFAMIAKLKATSSEVLDELEKALESMPSGEEIAKAVEELRGRAMKTLESARAERAAKVGSYEADFIRSARVAGTTAREAGGSAWRVGPLELELKRESSRARMRYNREPIGPWVPVASSASLEALYAKSLEQVEAAALPEQQLIDAFWGAYDYLRRHTMRTDTSSARVPLPEFYREVRIVLARHELASGKPDRKLSRTDFPRWSFLYNLDRYRKLHAQVPAERRLAFETGSQHDHSKGLAMIANGLDAGEDYKSYCYVYAVGAP